jgi:hypothetical protein
MQCYNLLMNLELKKYIEGELANDVSKQDIYTNLININWNREDIDEVFSELESNTIPLPPQATEGEVIEEEVPRASQTNNSRTILMIAGLCVFALLVSGLAVAYVFKMSPFSSGLPYSKETLASGIAMSLMNMKTFTYSMSGTFEVEDREPDAKPFVMSVTPEMKIFKEKYTRDYERISAVSNILSKINSTSSLPQSLGEILKLAKTDYYYSYQPLKTTDPLTGVEYSYITTQDNFRLIVTFETINAINTIMKHYAYDADKTMVDMDSKTVIFTKESPSYIYMSGELPKSYFEQLNQMASYMPPELFFKASIEATSDFKKEAAEWQVTLDVEGDFGDLIYRVDGDVMRKDKDYYFRVRNIPSLFSGFIAYEKGTWIKASEKWLEENNGLGYYSAPTFLIPDQEEEDEYKQYRNELSQFGVAVVKIADEEGVILVKNEPKKEQINGKDLYRYDLTFSKDKLVPFVKRVIDEAQKYKVTRESDLANDNTLLEYLESAEFDYVFDYYINNTSLTLFVNQEGFIELVEYSIRVVPGDEVEMLAKKQAKLTVSFGFDNINESVEIEAPTEYKNIEEMMEKMGGSSQYGGSATLGANTSIKSSLSRLRSEAELVYNNYDYSYTSVCEDADILSSINLIEETLLASSTVSGADTKVACSSGDTWYVIESPLTEEDNSIFDYWCIDSTGYSGGRSERILSSSQSCQF